MYYGKGPVGNWRWRDIGSHSPPTSLFLPEVVEPFNQPEFDDFGMGLCLLLLLRDDFLAPIPSWKHLHKFICVWYVGFTGKHRFGDSVPGARQQNFPHLCSNCSSYRCLLDSSIWVGCSRGVHLTSLSPPGSLRHLSLLQHLLPQ